MKHADQILNKYMPSILTHMTHMTSMTNMTYLTYKTFNKILCQYTDENKAYLNPRS